MEGRDLLLFTAVFLGLALYLVARMLPPETEAASSARARAEAILSSGTGSDDELHAAISDLVSNTDVGAFETAVLLTRLARLFARRASLPAGSSPRAPGSVPASHPARTGFEW